MIKLLISKINKNLYLGQMTTDAAYDILKCLSILTEKKYGILNLRVIYEENNKYYDAFVE